VRACASSTPQGRKEGEALLPGATWHDDAYEAAQGAHLAVLLTEWPQFRDLDLARLARRDGKPAAGRPAQPVGTPRPSARGLHRLRRRGPPRLVRARAGAQAAE
jgi:hypothetical protein